MGNETKKSKKSLSAFEKKFASERAKQGAGGVFDYEGEKYTTDYASEKKPVAAKKEPKKDSRLGKSSTISQKISNRAAIQEIVERTKKLLTPVTTPKEKSKRSDPRMVGGVEKIGSKKGNPMSFGVTVVSATTAAADKKKGDKKKSAFPGIAPLLSKIDSFIDSRNSMLEKRKVKGEEKDLTKITDKNKSFYKDLRSSKSFKSLPSKTQRMIQNIIDGKFSMGDAAKKKQIAAIMKSAMNVGGLTSSPMQNGLSRKINPTTGLTMNKGGMTDMRKSGMFYGGGMARRGR